jgi:predicted transglutaminase-like cysteine proteinase
MHLKKIIITLFLFIISGCANGVSNYPLKTGIEVSAPIGMKSIKGADEIDQLPLLLSSQLLYPSMPLHDPGFFSLNSELSEVKRILDKHFVYRTDKQMYGVNEDWRAGIYLPQSGAVINGDCEDYAILIRAMLLKRGIKSRLVMLETEYEGDYHIVNEVSGWIIDNRFPVVISHFDSEYRYISISEYDPRGQWRSVNAHQAPALALMPLAGLTVP